MHFPGQGMRMVPQPRGRTSAAPVATASCPQAENHRGKACRRRDSLGPPCGRTAQSGCHVEQLWRPPWCGRLPLVIGLAVRVGPYHFRASPIRHNRHTRLLALALPDIREEVGEDGAMVTPAWKRSQSVPTLMFGVIGMQCGWSRKRSEGRGWLFCANKEACVLLCAEACLHDIVYSHCSAMPRQADSASTDRLGVVVVHHAEKPKWRQAMAHRGGDELGSIVVVTEKLRSCRHTEEHRRCVRRAGKLCCGIQLAALGSNYGLHLTVVGSNSGTSS